MDDLLIGLGLENQQVGDLASSVQFGFIAGTLLFAVLSLADRISPSKLFFASALIGAILNVCSIWDQHNWYTLLFTRFGVGFFLAGIYPVGMKIAVDHFSSGLGKSLSFLVGALVLGTALPHLIGDLTVDCPWEWILACTSILAFSGGLLMLLFVPDGPHRREAQEFQADSVVVVFRVPRFRTAALRYFGHMWELYTFWTFVPLLLITYNDINSGNDINCALNSFAIIGIGGISSILGGLLSVKYGVKRIALIALSGSLICILISPIVIHYFSSSMYVLFLLTWGILVIPDSPMFSTLVAQNAEPTLKGTALTIVNCIGFATTIISIQIVQWLLQYTDISHAMLILAIGPILGLFFVNKPHNLSKS